jgi:23S rRNA (guanine745-N1)-methyltransferase
VIRLACPVRGCAEPLDLDGRFALRCPREHSFDRAREGYWNLLQPHDRRSRAPGDTAAAQAARRRWIEAGLVDPLVQELARSVARLVVAPRPAIVDLGCGDGSLLVRALDREAVELCGIDLSRDAIRQAARAWPDATWIVANADRRLPVADGAADLVLSLFGRRNPAEVSRILRPGGALVVAIPGPDDLIELRAAVQGRALSIDRVARTVDAIGEAFEPCGRSALRWNATLDAAGVADALRLTYRGARRGERERAETLASLGVTLAADVVTFRRRAR